MDGWKLVPLVGPTPQHNWSMTMRVSTVGTMGPWRFPSLPRFFGLTDKYMENVYEEIFSLKHHGGWSFVEAYSLPISLRRWFLKRLIRQFEDERKEAEKASKRR